MAVKRAKTLSMYIISLARARAELIYFIYHSCYLLARPESSCRDLRSEQQHDRDTDGLDAYGAALQDDGVGALELLGGLLGSEPLRGLPLEAADHGHKGGGGRGWWMRVVAGRVHVHTAALQRRLCVLDDFFG